MARSVSDWIDRFDEKPFSTTIQAGALLIAIGVVFTAIIWGITSGGSYWWGQGGAVQQKNSTANFIQAQAQFHRDLNAIQADQVKITQAKQAVTQFQQQHPGYAGNGTAFDPLAQQLDELNTTLTGLQQGCENEVADYNTAAQSYLSEDWRDAGLPDHLDVATTCQ